jgi:hypothetical protein
LQLDFKKSLKQIRFIERRNKIKFSSFLKFPLEETLDTIDVNIIGFIFNVFGSANNKIQYSLKKYIHFSEG